MSRKYNTENRPKKRTYEEQLQYARDYYHKNKDEINKKDRIKRHRNKQHQKVVDFDKHITDTLVIIKTKKFKNKDHKLIKLQDIITERWRLTGELVIPDEKIIKEVEKEIIKEELLYVDTIDDVDLNECIVPEKDSDTEELYSDPSDE